MRRFFSTRGVLFFLLFLSVVMTLYTAYFKIKYWGFDLKQNTATEVWIIDAHVSFKALGKPVKVMLSTPTSDSNFKVLREDISARGYVYEKDTKTGRATFSSLYKKGAQDIYYRLTLYDNKDTRGKVRVAEQPSITAPIYDDQQMQMIEDIFALAQKEEGNFVQKIIALFNKTPLNVTVESMLPLKATLRARAELIRNLLALKEIPTRLVHGVKLIEGKQAANADLMIEAYDGAKWSLYDLKTGVAGLPKDFIVFQRGNVSLLDVEGGENSKIKFSVLKSVTSSFAMAQRRAEVSSTAGFFTMSIYSLPLWAQNILKWLMVFPLGILVVVLMRNVVGVPTMGTFTPMLIAISLVETGFVAGIVCFTLIVGIGLILRGLLSRLNLLLVPRISAVVIFVILIIQFFTIIGFRYNLRITMSAVFFPIIITAWIIERVSITYEEEGPKNAFKESIYTILTAIATYFVIASETIRHITFAFNEINFVILFVVMLLGTYTGYRLTELKRFYPLIKGK